VFTGEYEHTIDAKQRLAIPAELRQRLHPDIHGTALYLVPGANGALWLWPEKTFLQMADALSSQSLLPPEELMEFDELLFSQASRLDVDPAGRIRLPERMLKRFGIRTRVTILGVRDHLELRDTGDWDARLEEKYQKQAQIMLRAREALQARLRAQAISEGQREGGGKDGP
jgi:MraZ protein